MTDWLEELRQLYEDDKAKQQAAELDLTPLEHPPVDVLQQVNSFNLLRQAQKALLGGKGTIEVVDLEGGYDRTIRLIWQGPISAARRPDPEDPEDCHYIAVSERDSKLYVNGKEVKFVTLETLKAALVEAARNPRKTKPGKSSK